ncbi:MAG: MFS transporter [Bacteroidia bacterium]
MAEHAKKNQPRTMNAWAFYDWANSVYPLVITSTIFPIFYDEVTKTDSTDIVWLFGFSFKNTVIYSYTLSVSFLFIGCLLPFLSGIADYGGHKKRFMKFFVYLGATGCSALFFFTGENLFFGLACFATATIGFTGSLVFYNAYLPEIATPDRFDRLSARGYMMGYIGSVVLLLFNLSMILFPDFYGVTKGFASRFSFLLVGFWWAGFAQITFANLPDSVPAGPSTKRIVRKGLDELRRVVYSLHRLPRLSLFLTSFFFYSMGVQTVMYMATLFGSKELKLETESLIITILIIQIVAILGAFLFSRASEKFGNINALTVAIIIWIGVCIGAYFTYTEYHFYGLAFVVGMVMGGIQSLSRSTYSKLLPPSRDNASYFSFYEISEKIAIVVGTASYGLIEDITGSMRNSVFTLGGFFLLGLFSLLLVGNKKLLQPQEPDEAEPQPDILDSSLLRKED